MDQWDYSELLRAAALRALFDLEETFKGVHSESGAPAPYRLTREQRKEVRRYVAGITAVIGRMELDPVPAARERAEHGYRRAAPRFIYLKLFGYAAYDKALCLSIDRRL